ncbi:prolipoprotein diacylglyceryl transferase [Spiroplasma platyhelix]|uniref:Phosphatidylglycerol--prolipoprotein diacylglyceryl transferase n=1 Tax=Spiroplasma platyhelix PALS-1 TaxID=1276218 RepID=A0A846TSI0_9MOLU|nr:prolipoprotein diacylglyceryl transferase [Spiroplasma platyhelix]MBE4704095.1 Prolipoprotein diacylglyceryl transferase [Spiroplasma platyhelix PALS-1]NKE38465.1 prolipoprotein diacylglyceryl transferase [Spiroplasma platyhelix PALS-1]UJB29353.1 prolipoprotein diacylglyceryl transferase [Spiroplasma platyhelix PALS-1]
MHIFSGYNDSIANIPGTSIHIYSILMGIAVLVVLFSSWFKMYRRNIPTRTLEGSVFIIIPCGLLGARLWYVLNHTDMVHGFIDVIAVWQGGMAIQGGIFAGLIVGLIIFYRASLKYKISMWVYLDCILPNILLGQAIGRWGNFFNQEILGWDTGQAFPWLPSWINDHLHYPNDHVEVYRHPLFLYESIASLVGWVFLIFVLPKIGFWFSKKPWKIEAEKYQPLWIKEPIVKSDYYQPWKVVKKLHSYRKWKKSCWEKAYYDFEPEKSLIKDTKLRTFKAIKVTPTMNGVQKIFVSQKNFFRKITNKFYQDASPLNQSYNPNQYKLTYTGAMGAGYFIFYGIIRVILEPFRYASDIMMIGSVRTSILVSVLWIILGIVLLVFAQFIASKKFRKKGWLYEKQY